MPREIETFDGVRWTTTKVRPTNNAPFAGLQGFGTVATPTPAGTVQGVTVKVFQGVNASGQRISRSQFDVLFIPEIKRLGFELAGDPELVIDDNPIWLWKQDPQEKTTWSAVVGSGPFSGLQGSVISFGTDTGRPQASDTSKLPVALESWTAALRPTAGVVDDAQLGSLRAALRTVAAPLRSLAGDGGNATSAVLAPVAKKSGSLLPLIGGALGIALLAMNTVPRTGR